MVWKDTLLRNQRDHKRLFSHSDHRLATSPRGLVWEHSGQLFISFSFLHPLHTHCKWASSVLGEKMTKPLQLTESKCLMIHHSLADSFVLFSYYKWLMLCGYDRICHCSLPIQIQMCSNNKVSSHGSSKLTKVAGPLLLPLRASSATQIH